MEKNGDKAISAAAFHTYKVSEKNSIESETIFQELLQSRDMLVQEFQETIVTKGEASLMVFNGSYTHAILKKAKHGDFRVQDDFGGTVHPYVPSQEEIEFAEFAMPDNTRLWQGRHCLGRQGSVLSLRN